MQSKTISRKQLLVGTAAVALTAPLLEVCSRPADPHKGHAMGKHGTDTKAKHPKLVASAMDCLRAGKRCLDHCLNAMAQGDKSLAKCARLVSETNAMCESLATMAALDSKHLGAMASVCIKVCRDCEKECRKHEKHHAACKACADACADCIKQCKLVA